VVAGKASVIANIPSALSRTILDRVFEDYPEHNFEVRLWDGSVWGQEDSPRFTILLHHPSALRRMFSSLSEQNLGEAYIQRAFDIEGDIVAAMDFVSHLVQREFTMTQRYRVATLLYRLPLPPASPVLLSRPHLSGTQHSLERDRNAISYHYDLPVDFYSKWLDSRMVYSCAYFREGDNDLESAQLQKLDYVCKKLRLRRGDRLLDIGCGWGALAIHAAGEYGVHVLGITLSQSQAAEARQTVHRNGLDGRCQIELCDYREVNSKLWFDKIVSIGMCEHVGQKLMPTYFEKAWELLVPGGVFLNHAISHAHTYKRNGPSFVDRYVFPDGDLLCLCRMLHYAEGSGFEVMDVESLRKHYTLTLKAWLSRFERNETDIRNVVEDSIWRTWRIFLAGSAHAFASGRLNVYETLLVKSPQGDHSLPLRRSDWYG